MECVQVGGQKRPDSGTAGCRHHGKLYPECFGEQRLQEKRRGMGAVPEIRGHHFTVGNDLYRWCTDRGGKRRQVCHCGSRLHRRQPECNGQRQHCQDQLHRGQQEHQCRNVRSQAERGTASEQQHREDERHRRRQGHQQPDRFRQALR